MSQFKQFYHKTLLQRQSILSEQLSIPLDTFQQQLSLDVANTIIENCIGTYTIPLGIVPNIIINHTPYHAPMATEEPSVIAAANYGASIIAKSGGFVVEKNERGIIGEIAFDITNQLECVSQFEQIIDTHNTHLIDIANNAYPSIVKRGGGAKKIWCQTKSSSNNHAHFFIVYLLVDTQEAMGANILNTMLEALKQPLEQLLGIDALMGILSNYTLQSLVTVTCRLQPSYLTHVHTTLSGKDVANNIVKAYQLATADVFRATTHNKGVMNGISAVVLASGNDTRAVEASIHAYASHSGQYQPITTWHLDDDNYLVGSITVPLPIGYVGGSMGIHPNAQLTRQLSQTKTVKELAALIASIGLAQNLAALRALVSEGIQKGHMGLHLKSLALHVGATNEEIPLLVTQLKKLPSVNQDIAKEQLLQLRKENSHDK